MTTTIISDAWMFLWIGLLISQLLLTLFYGWLYEYQNQMNTYYIFDVFRCFFLFFRLFLTCWPKQENKQLNMLSRIKWKTSKFEHAKGSQNKYPHKKNKEKTCWIIAEKNKNYQKKKVKILKRYFVIYPFFTQLGE